MRIHFYQFSRFLLRAWHLEGVSMFLHATTKRCGLWQIENFDILWKLARVGFMQRIYLKPNGRRIWHVLLIWLIGFFLVQLTWNHHFKVFDSIWYVHVLDEKRAKLDAKAKKCIFTGYMKERNGGNTSILRPLSLLFIKMLYFMKSPYTTRWKVMLSEELVAILMITQPHLEISLPLSLQSDNISSSPIGELSYSGVMLVLTAWRGNKVMRKWWVHHLLGDQRGKLYCQLDIGMDIFWVCTRVF